MVYQICGITRMTASQGVVPPLATVGAAAGLAAVSTGLAAPSAGLASPSAGRLASALPESASALTGAAARGQGSGQGSGGGGGGSKGGSQGNTRKGGRELTRADGTMPRSRKKGKEEEGREKSSFRIF
jgi:hypothetical protein